MKDKRIALFVANLYEDLEFWYPNLRMQEAGAEVVVIGPTQESFTGKHGLPAHADKSIQEVKADDFDVLIIPGGYSPDYMRRSPKMVEFVQNMHEQKKTIAAICHGGWMLASANIVNGKEVTSFFSIRDDLENAGARWVDKEVAIDGNIITSRTPSDLPAFCRAILSSQNQTS